MSNLFDEAVGVDFEVLEWQRWDKPGAVGRVKLLETQGKRFRLLELPEGFDEENWCLRGHDGYVLQGEFTVLFRGQEVRCRAGMAFCIPDGTEHRSRGSQSGQTVVVVVDKIVS